MPATAGVGEVGGVAVAVGVGQLGEHGIFGQELLGGGVVVAGKGVDEAALGIGVFAAVAEGRAGAAHVHRQVAVAVIVARGDHRAAAVGEGTQAAELVGVVVGGGYSSGKVLGVATDVIGRRCPTAVR